MTMGVQWPLLGGKTCASCLAVLDKWSPQVASSRGTFWWRVSHTEWIQQLVATLGDVSPFSFSSLVAFTHVASERVISASLSPQSTHHVRETAVGRVRQSSCGQQRELCIGLILIANSSVTFGTPDDVGFRLLGRILVPDRPGFFGDSFSQWWWVPLASMGSSRSRRRGVGGDISDFTHTGSWQIQQHKMGHPRADCGTNCSGTGTASFSSWLCGT